MHLQKWQGPSNLDLSVQSQLLYRWTNNSIAHYLDSLSQKNVVCLYRVLFLVFIHLFKRKNLGFFNDLEQFCCSSKQNLL